MKSRITYSHVTLSTLLTSSLFLSFVLCGALPGEVEPTGIDIGVVRFDALIELNLFPSQSSNETYTVLFARYWVARDYHSMGVIWGEPMLGDLTFCVPPPTLSVASKEQGIDIHHQTYGKCNESYNRPFGNRGVFYHKFGSYPVLDIRFAEQEALTARIYAADLKHLQDVNQPCTETLDLSDHPCEAGVARDVAKLRVQVSARCVDFMELLDAKGHLLKSINYEYANKDGKVYLRRQIVTLPERPMTVGFNGEGMKVTLDSKEYRYRELEAAHHASGRRCTVEYESVTLGGKEVILPVRVTVRGGKDDQILRCVHLMNFKKVELDAARAEEAARQFARFTDEQHKYRELRSKYWGKSFTEMEKPDIETIRQLRTRIENDAAAAGRNPGEKLKHLTILMELNLMLGDVPEVERYYQSYLSTLSENRLFKLTLIGGYGVIETAMFQGRRREASVLLDRWVDTVPAMNDAESVVLFARRQLAKTRFWTTVKLLEKLSFRGDLGAGVRFEAEALRCTALAELCKLLRADDLAEKGLAAKVETDWAASIGKNSLNTMLASNIAQAKRSFAELTAPTQSQKALKAQIDRIDQMPKKKSKSEE